MVKFKFTPNEKMDQAYYFASLIRGKKKHGIRMPSARVS